MGDRNAPAATLPKRLRRRPTVVSVTSHGEKSATTTTTVTTTGLGEKSSDVPVARGDEKKSADRLSELPTAVACHALAFLATACHRAAAVCSRRLKRAASSPVACPAPLVVSTLPATADEVECIVALQPRSLRIAPKRRTHHLSSATSPLDLVASTLSSSSPQQQQRNTRVWSPDGDGCSGGGGGGENDGSGEGDETAEVAEMFAALERARGEWQPMRTVLERLAPVLHTLAGPRCFMLQGGDGFGTPLLPRVERFALVTEIDPNLSFVVDREWLETRLPALRALDLGATMLGPARELPVALEHLALRLPETEAAALHLDESELAAHTEGGPSSLAIDGGYLSRRRCRELRRLFGASVRHLKIAAGVRTARCVGAPSEDRGWRAHGQVRVR